jgi:hypothetical protein
MRLGNRLLLIILGLIAVFLAWNIGTAYLK